MTSEKIKEFVERASTIHGGKYDYSLWTEYGGTSKDYHVKNVPVICPHHGIFRTSLANHLTRKSGCPQCGRERSIKQKRKPTEYFIEKAKKVHEGKYDYSRWKPVNNTSKGPVEIICPMHGPFFQTPANHIDSKAGCPKCASLARRSTCLERYGHGTSIVRHSQSYNEKQLSGWLRDIGIDLITNDRDVISPQELDIYIPDSNLAIEYCGIYWHSESNGKGKWYHKNKMDFCRDKGIRLLTIFEDEWTSNSTLVKNKILHILNKSKQKAVYARNTQAICIDSERKKNFLNQHHIQGNGPSSINMGLINSNNDLVAVMCFTKRSQSIFELTRYATSLTVVGGFSKLLKKFTSEYNWEKIVSFADCRWSEGDLYEKTGWTKDKVLHPDYYYSTNGHNRFHKFNYRRSMLPKKLDFFDPNLSERQNCDNNKLIRIWDCGKIRYILTNK